MKPFVLYVLLFSLALANVSKAEIGPMDPELELLVDEESLPDSNIDQGLTGVDSASELEAFFESVFGNLGRGLAAAFANTNPVDGGNVHSSMDFMTGDRQSVVGNYLSPVGPVDLSGLDFTSAANKTALYFTTPESASRKPGATPSDDAESELDALLAPEESAINAYFAEQVVGPEVKAKSVSPSKSATAPVAIPEGVLARASRIQAVPEPSAILLAGLATFLFACGRKRQHTS